MNRIITAFLLATLVVPLAAQAHETKHAGTLAILLHMEPLDDPAVGQDAQLYFSVDDSTGKFDFSNCECQVTVKDFSNRVLLDRKVAPADAAPDWGEDVARISFRFPAVGIYKVSIAGHSKKATFNDFDLEYDKRIERRLETDPYTQKPGDAGGSEALQSDVSYYWWIGGILLFFGIMLSSKRVLKHFRK